METELQASIDAATASSPASSPSAALPIDGLDARLRAALDGRGFTELTAVQDAVLVPGVEGRDLQISSQTGSGKTVALGFVIAAGLPEEADADSVRLGPEALIIVPTRELANQVAEELSWLFAGREDVGVHAVTGGTPVFRDRQFLRRRPRILVGTPGRLLDHVRSRALDLGSVRELVLDEADQMLDMGFREELEGILDTTPKTRRTHLVSATFPEAIRNLTARYQRDPLALEGTRLGDANQDIEHIGHLVDPRERYAALVNLLLEADGERTLVFVERRSDTAEVASLLEADGFASLPLSGELAQSQRERTLAAFRAGRATVLVATDVAARGLDVPDVATVVHTSVPLDAQVYTHRSGRTGRAGKTGRSILIAAPNRKRRVTRLLNDAGVDLRWEPVPAAAEVQARVDARRRARLTAELEEALGKGDEIEHLAHADELLADVEARNIVGALLARLQPKDTGRARDVRTQSAPRDEYRPYRDSNSSQYSNAGPSRYERPDRRPIQRGSSNRPDRSQPAGSVRFFINRGLNQGATPSRILASVCRRGEVTGSDIGSIAIHPNASTFDVNADVAQQFERLAGRRDPRDPETLIRLDRGPKPTGPRGARGPRRAY